MEKKSLFYVRFFVYSVLPNGQWLLNFIIKLTFSVPKKGVYFTFFTNPFKETVFTKRLRVES